MWTEIPGADGLRLAAEQAGDGDDVVLVHGLGFSRERWAGTMDALQRSGHRVTAFDLRGFGDSQMPEEAYGMDTLVSDIESIRQGLGVERFHLVGHSLGGMCAQVYTLTHPQRVRSLTLVSTTSHSGARGSAYGAALSHLAKHGFDQAMADDDFRSKVEMAIAFLGDAEVRSALDGTISHELPTGQRLLSLIERMTKTADPARAHAWRCTVGFSTRDRLPEIGIPTLVMHGTRDMIIPYVAGQLLHRGLRDSQWVSFHDAGHSVPMERESEFAQVLVDFLGTLDA